ncbi:MAG: hypothetical protein ACK5Q5_21415 [Planctomycetaceae bacterium]
METNFADLLGEHPEWQLTLQAYQAAEAVVAEQLAQERAAAKKASKTADEAIEPVPADEGHVENASDDGDDAQRKQTWVRRLREVRGVAADRLAPIHGRLIAEGLLQFSLGGRDEGVLYRLTRDAKQVLTARPPLDADSLPENLQLDEPGPVPQAA